MAHTIKLEEGEKIVREVRKHLFVLYMQTFGLFVVMIAPLLFISPIDKFLNNFISGRGGTLFGFIYILWFLVVWMIFFYRWTDYYLDVWVITTQRIFDIDQKGIFSREVSVFRLDRIQDVTVQVSGVFATFLHFGNILIHTAGENKELVIQNASNPVDIKDMIMEEHRRALHRSQKRDSVQGVQ